MLSAMNKLLLIFSAYSLNWLCNYAVESVWPDFYSFHMTSLVLYFSLILESHVIHTFYIHCCSTLYCVTMRESIVTYCFYYNNMVNQSRAINMYFWNDLYIFTNNLVIFCNFSLFLSVYWST